MANIRKARLADLERVVALFSQYRVFYRMEPNKEKEEKFITDRLTTDDSQIFVAETDNCEIVGFVQLYPLFSSTRMRRLWLLNDLFVDKKHRGKSISKQLIACSKDLCRQTDACGLILETEKKNLIGNNLYPSVGFYLDEEHNYYSWDL